LKIKRNPLGAGHQQSSSIRPECQYSRASEPLFFQKKKFCTGILMISNVQKVADRAIPLPKVYTPNPAPSRKAQTITLIFLQEAKQSYRQPSSVL
jgi:hypothetical protein